MERLHSLAALLKERLPIVGLAGVLAGFAAGLLLTASLQGIALAQEPSNETQAALIAREASLALERRQLQSQAEAAQQRLLELESITARSSEEAALARVALERARALSGQTDMRGPGVRVVLDDAPREAIAPGEDIRWYIVHDVDVLRVVNQLRGAGAECLSINGERLVSNSRIRCGGPTIHVKDTPLAPPFEILAIGNPEALYQSLADPAPDGGMSELEILGFFGVRAEVSKMEEVLIPRYLGSFGFEFASPLRRGDYGGYAYPP